VLCSEIVFILFVLPVTILSLFAGSVLGKIGLFRCVPFRVVKVEESNQ
jgi:hypothetical protein